MEQKHANLIEKMKIQTERHTEYDDSNHYEETRIVSILGLDVEIAEYTIGETLHQDLEVLENLKPSNSLDLITDGNSKTAFIKAIEDCIENTNNFDWKNYQKMRDEGTLPPMLEDVSGEVFLAMVENDIDPSAGVEALVALKDSWPANSYLLEENKCDLCGKYNSYIQTYEEDLEEEDLCDCQK